jgi:hypothetical protein
MTSISALRASEPSAAELGIETMAAHILVDALATSSYSVFVDRSPSDRLLGQSALRPVRHVN